MTAVFKIKLRDLDFKFKYFDIVVFLEATKDTREFFFLVLWLIVKKEPSLKLQIPTNGEK